jgi:hypothetical protein
MLDGSEEIKSYPYKEEVERSIEIKTQTSDEITYEHTFILFSEEYMFCATLTTFLYNY